MAINQQTLAAAEAYATDQDSAHVAAYDPHPQYAKLVDVDGFPTGGDMVVLKTTDPMPPVVVGSILFAPPFGVVPMGIYLVNEAGTAWVLIGNGPLPTDVTAPTVPGNFRVTATTASSIAVAWNASTDAETGIGGYDVSIDSGAWVSLANVLTYTFSSLTASSSHTMRVRARDNATTPNVSAAATVSGTTAALPVTVPQNLRVTATAQTSLTFAWDAPPSGTISRYEWRLAGGTFATNSTATTKQVTGLTADTLYTFGVRAVFTDNTTSSEVTLTARTSATTSSGGVTRVGTHVSTASSAEIADNPELGIYSGMTQTQVLQKIEDDMRALTGFSDTPLMDIGHIFHGTGSGYVMKSWGTTQLNRMGALIASFKPTGGANAAGLQRVIAGTDDTAIKSLISSLPTGKRIYLGLHHEPDNDLANSEITYWRQAQAHWARLIIDNRGARDIHPFVCLMTWTFRTGNESTLAQWLQVTNDFTAASVDWKTQVVMAPDGYEDDPSAVPDAATTFANVFPQLKAAGWQRFGITETACPSKVGDSGGKTITSADVTAATGWTKSVLKVAAVYSMEYVCWFNATGAKGPIGSWQYTDAVKAAWGAGAHYNGPAPGW